MTLVEEERDDIGRMGFNLQTGASGAPDRRLDLLYILLLLQLLHAVCMCADSREVRVIDPDTLALCDESPSRFDGFFVVALLCPMSLFLPLAGKRSASCAAIASNRVVS